MQRTLKKTILISSISCAAVVCWFVGGVIFGPNTPGNIVLYQFQASKAETKRQIVDFFIRNPERVIPQKYYTYAQSSVVRPLLSNDPSSVEDSSEMYLYDGLSNSLLWFGFTGRTRNWSESPCEIALVGVANPYERWKFAKQLTPNEEKLAMKYFESFVLDSLSLHYKRE